MSTYHATHHFLDRWAERFPGHDLAAAFARSVPVPLSRLMGWQAHKGGRGSKLDPACEYHHDRATGAVFVSRAGVLLTAWAASAKG